MIAEMIEVMHNFSGQIVAILNEEDSNGQVAIFLLGQFLARKNITESRYCRYITCLRYVREKQKNVTSEENIKLQ